MGASGKWVKALFSLKKATKASSDIKDKSRTHEKSKRWTLWKSSHDEKKHAKDAEIAEAEHMLVVSTTSAAAAAAEAVFAAATTAAVVNLTNGASHPAYMPMREARAAATAIQTAFRGFLARRAFRALKGLVRLQALVRGHIVRKQTAATFRSMQALIRVQTQVRAYRAHISSEGEVIQQKIKERHKIEAQIQEFEQGWCDTIGTMEAMQAKVQQRQEAAIKRERALAYAFCNQWRANSRADLQDLELDRDNWGWLWLEKWMATRPLESQTTDQISNPGLGMSSTNCSNVAGKKKTGNVSHSVKVKRSSRFSFDASKDNPKSLVRGGSHNNLLLAHMADEYSDESFSPSSKGISKVKYGLDNFSVKPPERRAFSNPKQRPQSEEVQPRRRISMPNHDIRSAAMQKQYVPYHR